MAPTAGTRLRFRKVNAKNPHKSRKVPSLKNRIRALERFLKRGGHIDEDTRAAKTNELAQLQGEQTAKERVEEEKKKAEKTKKPRFFERVKLMRKLKKAKARMDEATDKSEAKQAKKEYQAIQHDLMYIYYYPKAEQYLSLFPAKPHSEEALAKQKALRAGAIQRFEVEQLTEAFHKFCYADGSAAPASNAAAALLVKKPTKEEEKKKKKARSKKDKSGGDEAGEVKAKKAKKEARVVADEDVEVDSDQDKGTGGGEEEAEEADDFFLS